jgi:hypothetical protein
MDTHDGNLDAEQNLNEELNPSAYAKKNEVEQPPGRLKSIGRKIRNCDKNTYLVVFFITCSIIESLVKLYGNTFSKHAICDIIFTILQTCIIYICSNYAQMLGMIN